MELRLLDPRKLKANPNNPRRTKAPPQDDAQLAASIKAIGLMQPPMALETGKKLTILAGHRRVAAAIEAGLSEIPVLVQAEADGQLDPMRSIAENLIRTEMGPVDRWRAMEALAGAGWSEAAIATALGLTPRGIAQLRLLAKITPAMLDHMARGDVPKGAELRVIAAAGPEEQASVWKAHKPKRGEPAQWSGIAQALAKQRLYARDAKFGADEVAAFGIAWEEDLFAPADEDSRSTTQVEAYFAAQQAWLEANLPANGTLVATDEFGRAQLPKGAQERYTAKPGPGDQVAVFVDPRSGQIRQTVYDIPQRERRASAGEDAGPRAPATRPPVTQKGDAIIGDMRTDALHQALREQPIDDDQLIGLLVLALGSQNVEVRTGLRATSHYRVREGLAERLTEGRVLTRDPGTLRQAAREALAYVLSCRDNHSDSGLTARYAGAAIGADGFLPNMATAAFLPCLSKAAVEAAAAAEGVQPGARAKDTRAALIERFAEATYVYPAARFAPTEAEAAARKAAPAWREDVGEDAGGSGDAAAGDPEGLDSDLEQDSGDGEPEGDEEPDAPVPAALGGTHPSSGENHAAA